MSSQSMSVVLSSITYCSRRTNTTRRINNNMIWLRHHRGFTVFGMFRMFGDVLKESSEPLYGQVMIDSLVDEGTEELDSHLMHV